jgi:hypothetical protein
MHQAIVYVQAGTKITNLNVQKGILSKQVEGKIGRKSFLKPFPFFALFKFNNLKSVPGTIVQCKKRLS